MLDKHVVVEWLTSLPIVKNLNAIGRMWLFINPLLYFAFFALLLHALKKQKANIIVYALLLSIVYCIIVWLNDVFIYKLG